MGNGSVSLTTVKVSTDSTMPWTSGTQGWLDLGSTTGAIDVRDVSRQHWIRIAGKDVSNYQIDVTKKTDSFIYS